VGEPVILIASIAVGLTVVVTVAECGPVDSVGPEIVAVLVIVEPLAALELTWTTMLKIAVEPAAKLVRMPVIVLVPPAAGVVNVKAGPDTWVSETKVVLTGRHRSR
jgi:hypothetical protein